MFVLITGNPVDGFEYIGPFTSSAAAHNWAENDAHISDHEWWISKLQDSGDAMEYVDGVVPEPQL